jgi:hypothetical protein
MGYCEEVAQYNRTFRIVDEGIVNDALDRVINEDYVPQV